MRDTSTIRLPRDLLAELKALADHNRRTITAEATIALEKHIASEKPAAKKKSGR